MNVIFLGLKSVHDFIIAIKVSEGYQSYYLVNAEYGWDVRDKVEDSNQVEEISLDCLPDDLSNIYEWNTRIKPRLVKAWVPKPNGIAL